MWVVASACSGGDEKGDGEGAQVSEDRLPNEVCRLLDRFDENEDALLSWEILELDEVTLADVLEERRDLLAQLVDETEGGLQTLMEERARVQPVVDEAMLDSWDEERARLDDEHNIAILEEAVGTELEDDEGEEIDLPAYWRTTQAGYQRLVVGCRAPELAHGPDQETSEDPPPGRLAFYRPPDPESDDQGGQVVVAKADGTDEQELEISEVPGASDDPGPWAPTGMLEASPGPAPHLVVNTQAGDQYALVEVDLDGTIVDFPQRSTDGPIACPGWDRQGERLLVATESRFADERRVHIVDMTRATPSGPVPVPLATASCSDFITDDRIVVSAAMDLDDDTAVWTVGLDGSDPEELYRADGCTTQVGSVDPEGTRVALAQNCTDPLDSGIVVVDLSSGESQRVVTGIAALPKWSPDGEWLVFGYSPLGENNAVGVWIAHPDGHQLREVVASPAWFPVWLPPA